MEITREFDSALSSLSGGSVDGHRYLLGVSGGIDSMCMARLFLDSSLHPDFAIAHVNFSLRGEESDGDMDSVVEWGRANGIQVFTRTFDTHAYSCLFRRELHIHPDGRQGTALRFFLGTHGFRRI